MQADKIFEALASAQRRKILAYLSKSQLTTSDLAERFEMTAPSMSRHLSVLENAGLVTSERRGQRVLYQLNSDNLVNTLTGFALEICPVAGPLKRESRALAKRRRAVEWLSSTPSEQTLRGDTMAAVRPLPPFNAAGFNASSDDVFGRIAARYDMLCDLFSLGIHRYWKRRVAETILREPWEELLDVASGTGDIVLRVLDRRETRNSCHVMASDISQQMLSVAERRLARQGYTVELRCQDAHSLSGIAANSVDLYSISLGLKICDRSVVLRSSSGAPPRQAQCQLGWFHRHLGADLLLIYRIRRGSVTLHRIGTHQQLFAAKKAVKHGSSTRRRRKLQK
jgi:DNA-binding transcriptional ArsR family regulator/SAM-dependent methyltransferase